MEYEHGDGWPHLGLPLPLFRSTYPGDGMVDRLERLESLGHEEVGELLLHRLHATRHLQDHIIRLLSIIEWN